MLIRQNEQDSNDGNTIAETIVSSASDEELPSYEMSRGEAWNDPPPPYTSL